MLLKLVALAALIAVVAAYPALLGGCEHPTIGLGSHGAPQADRYVQMRRCDDAQAGCV
jgi:hypothetical protein